MSNKLIVKALDDGIRWELVEDFTFLSFTVPKGFITDFASIPRLFWRFIGPPATGKYRKPAVLHDWLYFKGVISREKCDRIFYNAMVKVDVPLWKRQLMYWACRLFAWIGWKRHRKKRKEGVKIK